MIFLALTNRWLQYGNIKNKFKTFFQYIINLFPIFYSWGVKWSRLEEKYNNVKQFFIIAYTYKYAGAPYELEARNSRKLTTDTVRNQSIRMTIQLLDLILNSEHICRSDTKMDRAFSVVFRNWQQLDKNRVMNLVVSSMCNNLLTL